jgi:hypothetical protein
MNGPCYSMEGKLACAQVLVAIGGPLVDMAAQVKVGPLLLQALQEEALGLTVKPTGRMMCQHDEQLSRISRVEFLK